jgi:hypothetical protein
LKEEIAKPQRDRRPDEEITKHLTDNTETWREAYASMAREKFAAELRAANLERKLCAKNNTIDQMTQQIFQLRGDIEEFKITENALLDEYETLISSIRGCCGVLGYHLGFSDEWKLNEQVVRSRLMFDSPVLSQHALHEYRLPTEMLRLLIEGAQEHLYQRLTRWWDIDGDGMAQPGAFGTALGKFELDVISLIAESKAGAQKSNVFPLPTPF